MVDLTPVGEISRIVQNWTGSSGRSSQMWGLIGLILPIFKDSKWYSRAWLSKRASVHLSSIGLFQLKFIPNDSVCQKGPQFYRFVPIVYIYIYILYIHIKLIPNESQGSPRLIAFDLHCRHRSCASVEILWRDNQVEPLHGGWHRASPRKNYVRMGQNRLIFWIGESKPSTLKFFSNSNRRRVFLGFDPVRFLGLLTVTQLGNIIFTRSGDVQKVRGMWEMGIMNLGKL